MDGIGIHHQSNPAAKMPSDDHDPFIAKKMWKENGFCVL